MALILRAFLPDSVEISPDRFHTVFTMDLSSSPFAPLGIRSAPFNAAAPGVTAGATAGTSAADAAGEGLQLSRCDVGPSRIYISR